MTIEDRTVGLEEALRLSAAFSARSADGEVPPATMVPVPRSNHCEFAPRPWGRLDEAEREAFRRFYQRVGGALEEAAADIRSGVEISENAWSEITRGVEEEEEV